MSDQGSTEQMPEVADHELLRAIGGGSFGQVWLARSLAGAYRAVKFVFRKTFREERPFLREFHGVRHFEPISRSHPGFVPVLHIGQGVGGEYFYYVMELADDVERGREVEPLSYQARTLSSEVRRRGRLPLAECREIGMGLAAGLGYLHQSGLVHRDIKPSNIIFIAGTPRFADVGLVTPMDRSASHVGTEGYFPREGPGTPVGDLYGLGKVLYELSTGKDRLDFPDLPSEMLGGEEGQLLGAFNDVVVRACDPLPRQRFQNAQELYESLWRLQGAGGVESGVERKWFQAVWFEKGPPAPVEQPQLEAIGGAVPLDSALYVERAADVELRLALDRGDSVVLVKGARQMGKTSLLARGLQAAREAGGRVVLTDFQELNDEDLSSLKRCYLALGGLLAEQLELPVRLHEEWEDASSPNMNLDRFLRKALQAGGTEGVYWGLDEVDRLFGTPFGAEVFGLFRAWHNKRALDPQGVWRRLTMAMAYATEAHLFITNLNQSPFNVGTRIALGDFTRSQVEWLNERHGRPLRSAAEVTQFFDLVGGQPFLVRRGLYEMAARKVSVKALQAGADREGGVYGDHLKRILLALEREEGLFEGACGIISGRRRASSELFFRLRAAGVLTGDTAEEARPRCELYTRYLMRTCAERRGA